MFDFIDNSRDIQKMVVDDRYGIIIQKILAECGKETRPFDDDVQVVFATGILHYTLKRALLIVKER